MPRTHATDRNWEQFGELDPYYGVLTADAFRRGQLDQAALDAFFATGQAHIEHVLAEVHAHLDPTYRPHRALDFGCGVGRILLPLAAHCETVVGVDIAPAMLAEARRNCDARGVSNVELALSDDHLTQVTGRFDFIHSFIVLQHIRPERGQPLFHRLVDRLTDNGVGVLHITYRRQTSRLRRWIYWARRALPGANAVMNVWQRRPVRYPAMEMSEYHLEHLFQGLHQAGCLRTYVQYKREVSPHTQTYGLVLFFQKAGAEM